MGLTGLFSFLARPIELLKNIPQWFFAVVALTLFLQYYLRKVAKKPILIGADGKFRKFLDVNLPILKEIYWPTLWCFEARAHTVLASLLRLQLPDITYEREILPMNDGGEVGLDWVQDGCRPNDPVILFLPGLTGSSDADYIKVMIMSAVQLGVRCVVFNNRGLGGTTLRTPRTYCASNFEDLSDVIDHVKTLHPDAPVICIGVSMGGLILGNYLAAKGSEAAEKLTACMVISVPWNVAKGVESIEKPVINLLLNYHLCSNLRSVLQNLKHHFQEGQWNIDHVFKSRTIREFDSTFTAKQFGYKDVDDYYSAATIHNKIQMIKTPLLCLNAADDPFQPLEALPLDAIAESKYVGLVVTEKGGHIGFLEGIGLRQNHYICRILTQYITGIVRDVEYFKTI